MIRGALCSSYRREILEGVHRKTDIYKLALYREGVDLSAATTVYTLANEVDDEGYIAGGKALEGFHARLEDGVAILDWTDPTWADATITARGAMVYNATRDNRAVAVWGFGATVTHENFRVHLKNLIRIASMPVQPLEATSSGRAGR